MKLTGKCKEEFGKWLVCGEGSVNFEKYYSDEYGDDDPYLWFTELPASMQYGVYVDFFDSVGIRISTDNFIDTVKDSEFFMFIICDCKSRHLINHVKENTPFIKSRPEARTVAIEKANEIYNKI